jgi:hypothetical protein
MNGEPRGGYAEVNGLNMYYEIHGAGQPRVVLHGAYMTIDAMGEVVPSLAETRRVIAVEPQLAVLPGTTHFVPPAMGSWTAPIGWSR